MKIMSTITVPVGKLDTYLKRSIAFSYQVWNCDPYMLYKLSPMFSAAFAYTNYPNTA
jgi:hypothetical protein